MAKATGIGTAEPLKMLESEPLELLESRSKKAGINHANMAGDSRL